MPHINIKLWPGRSDEAKIILSEKIAEVVSKELDVNIDCVSVAFEEVEPSEWDALRKKEIINNKNCYRKSKV